MEAEGRDGRSVYNSIWIAFEAQEMSLHIAACVLAANL